MSSHMLKKGTAWATLFTYMATFMVPAAQAAPVVLATTPLFISAPVKPNIMLSLDDSGSMDDEVLMRTNDGAMWWNTTVANRSFVGLNNLNVATPGVLNYNQAGNADATWKKYVYLFPNGSGATNSGRRVYDDTGHFAIPPTPDYAFTRSPDYNTAYYNHEAKYVPWVSYGTTTFGNADPTKAPYDPAFNPTTLFLDLTTTKAATATAGWTFKVHNGMKRSDGVVANADIADGNTLSAFAYDPATYYLKDPSLTFTYNGTAATYGDPANYTNFVKGLLAKGGTVMTNGNAIGPDGAFLKKHQILATDTVQMQNFANWFTYYRKRHTAMRGGIGHAFKDMTNIRTGLFRINNRVAVTMLDFDTLTERNTFYSTLYNNMVGNGGTPNREGLDWAGQQFMRTNAGAPIIAQCQINAAIAFTDGFSLPASLAGVANDDGGKGAPYQDAYSDTIADVAMKYYSTNLRPDLLPAGKVPVSPLCKATPLDPTLDCNTNLHMNTFGVTLGTQGNIFGVTHNSVADAYATPPAWVDPTALRHPVQVDDLYHAAINGRGDMLNATTPGEIQDKMQEVLENISDRVGSAAAVAFNSTSLSLNSVVYQARFNAARWSGGLLAYKLNPLDGSISTTPTWDASVQVNAQTPASRTILTYNPITKVGIDFTWDTSALSAAQQADLNMGPAGADGNGAARLDYLRGDRSNEGRGTVASPKLDFRKRSSSTVLGDIVQSNPVYVGKPDLNYPNSGYFTGYDTFKGTTRDGVVYVGANDGMLHGFNAVTGDEVMAYIPHNLFSSATTEGLHYLTDKTYKHRYYVDLGPTVADAFIKTTSLGSAAWNTVLIGGERGGGRGFFALDITDPTKFSTNPDDVVMWEFSDADDADLGYTYNKPAVALMNNGKWAAIFGNGYNDSGTGEATLFIVYLEGGVDGSWSLGSDYIKITTKAGDTITRNGLASSTLVDLNGDYTVDRVYAGDLQGNMWAFDVSDLSDTNWAVAYKTGVTPKPLFTAKNGTFIQPITIKPAVVKHPTVASVPSNAPNLLVLFGTGQYLTASDPGNTDPQAFYGVWDNGTQELTRAKLQAQTLLTGFPATARVPSNLTVEYTNPTATREYGWYIDLPTGSERVVVNPKVKGDYIFFNTLIPTTALCSYGGAGWLMNVKLSNGGEPDKTIIDYNGDGKIDSLDNVTNGTVHNVGGMKVDGVVTESVFLGNKRYTSISDGTIKKDETLPDPPGNTGRLSWQEMIRP